MSILNETNNPTNEEHAENASEMGFKGQEGQGEKSENKETYKNRILVDLLKKAIGSRSIIEFTTQCGLSISFVSRLLNNNLPSRPSKRSLLKMAGNLLNGVTLSQLLVAAGYEDDCGYIDEIMPANRQDSVQNLPSYTMEPTYAMSLLVNVLVESKQLAMPLDIAVQPGLFEVKGKADGKWIVGLPAICRSEEESIDSIFHTLQLSFIMALSMYSARRKDICFVIVTNQERIFNDFEVKADVMDNMELYCVLTKDYYRFCQEKRIPTLTDGANQEIFQYRFLN